MRRARPVQREHALQAAVASYLTVALPEGAWFSSIDHAKRGPIEGARLKRRGVKRGLPDVVIFWHADIWIELKVKGNKPNDGQLRVGGRISRSGGEWCWVRSVEELELFLRTIGVPLRASCLPKEAA